MAIAGTSPRACARFTLRLLDKHRWRSLLCSHFPGSSFSLHSCSPHQSAEIFSDHCSQNASLPFQNHQQHHHHHRHWSAYNLRRKDFSSAASSSDVLTQEGIRSAVEDINRKFAEAREDIELALESRDTVYFNEESETARQAVEEVLEKFSELQSKVSEDEKGNLKRSMGLKIEQLKGELEQLKHED
eukprot:TRINITY_DN16638_c0_g1_i1.p1 TRINITY_DN16638_c0_g1~~TRINITY_DN16638_c0_g1_i1.p1  ORF type:complete len:196 (+),score=23.80 TRINITY_DN16638_c0_g1_i1:30-590(+)